MFIPKILDRMTEDAMMYLGNNFRCCRRQGINLYTRIEEGAKYEAWIRRCTMLM